MLKIDKSTKTYTITNTEENHSEKNISLVPRSPMKHPRRIPYEEWYEENKSIVDTIVKTMMNTITESQIDYQDGIVQVNVAIQKSLDDLYNMVYLTSYNSLK